MLEFQFLFKKTLLGAFQICKNKIKPNFYEIILKDYYDI